MKSMLPITTLLAKYEHCSVHRPHSHAMSVREALPGASPTDGHDTNELIENVHRLARKGPHTLLRKACGKYKPAWVERSKFVIIPHETAVNKYLWRACDIYMRCPNIRTPVRQGLSMARGRSWQSRQSRGRQARRGSSGPPDGSHREISRKRLRIVS